MTKKNFWFSIKICAALILVAVTAMVVTGFSNNNNERRITGSWRATVTAVNPPVGQFAGLITFEDKGTVVESRRLYVPQSPFGSLLETSGHGAWKRVGPREYQVNFVFLIQGAPDNPAAGQPLGTDNISLRLHLSPDGETLNGTFQSQIKDEAGNVIFTATGNYAATRIEAQN